MQRESSRSRRERWERYSRVPLLAGAAVFLAAFSWLILDPSISRGWFVVLLVLLGAVWASFITDVIVRLALTPRKSRGRFIREHRVDFLSAVVPILRPFGLLRYLHKLRGFRGNGGGSLRSRLVVGTLAYEGMFVYVISLSVLAAERNAPHATIVSFGDAVWWACVTVATVGYGDYSPVTVLGRFLAVLLMAGGVFIIGTASATIISYLNERVDHVRAVGGPERHENVSTEGASDRAGIE